MGRRNLTMYDAHTGRTLERVLEQWTILAGTVRTIGHALEADLIEKICSEVTAAAEEYLCWLSESEATLKCGRSVRWLRSQFATWARAGHARQEGKHRLYRSIVVPVRTHPQSSESRRAA